MREAAAGEGPPRLIGQFGVGFYSAFMVASRSKSSPARPAQTRPGSGARTAPAPSPSRRRRLVEEPPWHRGHAPSERGCRGVPRAPPLEAIVRRYSDHIAHPIMIVDDKAADSAQINAASAIWMRPKAEMSPEEHKEFFGHVSGLYADPALTIHYRAEGRHEYTVLLFVPAVRPFDLYDPDRTRPPAALCPPRLHHRRCRPAARLAALRPRRRRLRGPAAQCQSREMLQHNPTVAAIRKALLRTGSWPSSRRPPQPMPRTTPRSGRLRCGDQGGPLRGLRRNATRSMRSPASARRAATIAASPIMSRR